MGGRGFCALSATFFNMWGPELHDICNDTHTRQTKELLLTENRFYSCTKKKNRKLPISRTVNSMLPPDAQLTTPCLDMLKNQNFLSNKVHLSRCSVEHTCIK